MPPSTHSRKSSSPDTNQPTSQYDWNKNENGTGLVTWKAAQITLTTGNNIDDMDLITFLNEFG